MQRIIQLTADGSPTIAIPAMQVTYHSRHGAVQESRHVFIEAGLQPLLKHYPVLRVFEMGFGTGLNAMLTIEQAILQNQSVFYLAVEKYPLSNDEVSALHYPMVSTKKYFRLLHQSTWNKALAIHPLFTLYKSNIALQDYEEDALFHLIYYDAFAPAAQPELWTVQVFEQLYTMLASGGVLVTYCSKGNVRRNILAAGFSVAKLAGPPGKKRCCRQLNFKTLAPASINKEKMPANQ